MSHTSAQAGAAPATPIIQTRDLTKTYGTGDGAVHALRDVNLSIQGGQIFGIIGMSGAGKSTLIRCINLLDAPTSGKILFRGEDITLLPQDKLRAMRRQVGMVFQQFNLLMQRTVLKNICFPMEIAGMGKAQAKRRALELLDIVELTDKKDAYPAQLSGGQKQRVAIARALSMNPMVLLCDEATSALDPMTTRSILELLQDIHARLGITILVITHEMEVVRQICTHLAVLDGGTVAETGSVEQVFTRPRTPAGRRLFATAGAQQDLAQVTPRAVHGGELVRVVFEGEAAFEPVIAQMILALGAPISILSADIQPVAGTRKGHMLLEMPPDAQITRRVIEYLRGRGFAAEEVRS